MKRPGVFMTIFFALLLCVAALGIGAAVDLPATLMSPAVYEAGKREIEAGTRVALTRCRAVSGTPREICRAEVRAEEHVKMAELNARYHGTVSAIDAVRHARAKALYDVAKARCSGRGIDERIECLRAAREARNRTLAEAGAGSAT